MQQHPENRILQKECEKMKRAYKIGLYEKAMRSSLSWKELLLCAKECGYDYVEMCIDATQERIDRIYMSPDERLELVKTMYEAKLPIRSMSVSALTKYAVGDPDEEIRGKAMEILEGSIKLAADLGIRTVMLPGYDIYYGESTLETKQLFLENIQKAAEIGQCEGVLLGFETMENEFMNTVHKGMKYINLVNSVYLQMYPDSGNITNGAYNWKHDVCEDLETGRGHIIALHLKESKPGIFREVPYFTGHVDFEAMIKKAWSLGVRRFVTELWDVGLDSWKEDIKFANKSMREILDRQ